MNQSMIPGEDELHAYVDGRLEPQRRAEVERYLAGAPEVAARVDGWRRDAESLRAALAGWATLPANPRLDPAAIRRSLQTRNRGRMALAASMLLVLSLGGLGGWQMRGMEQRPLPMQDAVEAYRIFATDRLRPVEFKTDEHQDLTAWLSGRVGRPLALPDLAPYGYTLLGGRLLSTAEGAAALLLYEDGKGQRLSFYVRPSTRYPDGEHGVRDEQGLSTQYWFRNGYGFAVVGSKDDPHTQEVQQAIQSAI